MDKCHWVRSVGLDILGFAGLGWIDAIGLTLFDGSAQKLKVGLDKCHWVRFSWFGYIRSLVDLSGLVQWGFQLDI